MSGSNGWEEEPDQRREGFCFRGDGPRVSFSASLGVLLAVWLWCVPVVAQQSRWWKGSLHTHTLWSDGDEYPEMVLDWYKTRGWNFVVLSDHNVLLEGDRWIDTGQIEDGAARLDAYRERFGDAVDTREPMLHERVGTTFSDRFASPSGTEVRLKTLEEVRPLFDEEGKFLVVQGEEISDSFGDVPIHVNATNVDALIAPQGGETLLEVMQRNIDAVYQRRDDTGQPMFPHLNHPNFQWAVTLEDFIDLHNERFFEVYNGHPLVNNYGDADHPSTEEMWDRALAARVRSGGQPLYGLAVDDGHSYSEMSSRNANPGRGWVMVRAPRLTPEALIEAMERGDFYSSSGVVLREFSERDGLLRVSIEPVRGVSYSTWFIGTRRDREPGEFLAEQPGTEASYRLRGDELYVRALIRSDKRKENPYREGEREMAWTQPWFPPPPQEAEPAEEIEGVRE